MAEFSWTAKKIHLINNWLKYVAELKTRICSDWTARPIMCDTASFALVTRNPHSPQFTIMYGTSSDEDAQMCIREVIHTVWQIVTEKKTNWWAKLSPSFLFINFWNEISIADRFLLCPGLATLRQLIDFCSMNSYRQLFGIKEMKIDNSNKNWWHIL